MAKILIADDDPLFLEIISVALVVRGHEVTTAPNGVEALEYVRAMTFDLFITDIHMPEKDGLETIMALKAMNCSVPIIAVSAGQPSGFGDYLATAKAFGAKAALLKPLRVAELHDVILKLTDGVAQVEPALG